MVEKSSSAWMITHSGIRFELERPTKEMINFEDIAHHLSRICRFTGALDCHYSVAQHACLVHDMLDTPLYRNLGLHHDDHEAYTGDINSPLKSLLQPNFQLVEGPIQRLIWEKLGISRVVVRESSPIIHAVDLRMCQTEYEQLFPSEHPDWDLGVESYSYSKSKLIITPWSAERAKYEYLERLYAFPRT